MITDGLAFISDPALPDGSGSVSALLESMDELHIGRALVCGGKRAEGETANAQTADALRKHPDRLTGLIRVSPWMREWRSDLELYSADPAFAGILLHPWEDGFRMLSPALAQILELAAEKGFPVTVAAGYPWVSEALQIGILADRFPGTTFVLSNEGQLNISGLGAADVTLLLGQSPNVVLHTTGAYREDFLVSLASQYGPERLMYASGYPRFSPAYELRRVEWAHAISDAAKEQILSATASTVFRLPEPHSRPEEGSR